MLLASHFKNEIYMYSCLVFSALFMLKDRGIFVSSVLSCFPFFPVEKRASGFTLLERDIHV